LLVLGFGVGFAQTPKRPKPAPLPPAPTAYTIEALAVEGNHAHTAEQILAATGLRVGQKAGKSEFEAARDKLEATGVFDKVSYRFAPSQDGEGYDVWFEVAEVAQLYPIRFEDLPAADA
jgi:outer membrane protein assembly factor BamA